MTWLSSNPSIHGFNRLSVWIPPAAYRTNASPREPQAACRYPMKELHSMSNQLATPPPPHPRDRPRSPPLSHSPDARANRKHATRDHSDEPEAGDQGRPRRHGVQHRPQGLVRFNRLLGERRAAASAGDLPNSQLGSERELIEAVQLGSVGMTFRVPRYISAGRPRRSSSPSTCPSCFNGIVPPSTRCSTANPASTC